MVEGYGDSQEMVKALGKKCKIYLQSKKEKISLKAISFYEGDFHLSQAFFRPVKALREGRTYKIVIEGHNDDGSYFKQYSRKKEDIVKVRWTVRGKGDYSKPRWKKYPKLLKKIYIGLGCGPEIHADFLASVNDLSECLIKTVLVNKKTGKKTIYHLCRTEGKIEVGHGMCAGGFQFRSNQPYYVKLSIVDAAGNHSKKMIQSPSFNMDNLEKSISF